MEYLYAVDTATGEALQLADFTGIIYVMTEGKPLEICELKKSILFVGAKNGVVPPNSVMKWISSIIENDNTHVEREEMLENLVKVLKEQGGIRANTDIPFKVRYEIIVQEKGDYMVSAHNAYSNYKYFTDRGYDYPQAAELCRSINERLIDFGVDLNTDWKIKHELTEK